MKELYKSFFKLNPIKTVQILSFIVFIFLFSGITLGLISTPIQIISVANKVNHQQTKWDYSWETYWDIYDNEFLYEYFEKDAGKNNFLKTSLLNLDLEIQGEKLENHLKDYFSRSVHDYKNYQDFIGNFIKNNVFSFSYLYSHEVLIPSSNDTKILVNFKDLVKEDWATYAELNYGQVYRIINNDLIRLLKLDNFKIDSHFTYSYSWSNYGDQRTTFHLEPVNLNQSNNVVMLKGNKNNLLKMKDNEIIINDKYAKLHHLKIGDYFSLNNFVRKNGEPLSYGAYKIIGFGTKINNLFSSDTSKQNNYNSEVYCYLTDNEMWKYVKYLYEVDNLVILPNGKTEYQNQIFLKTRITANKSAIKNFSNALNKRKILNENIFLKQYQQEEFSKILTLYIIQASLFIVIGALLLICSVFFINYCLKKELVLIAPTIKILKASGYYSAEIASIFWLKVIFMLVIGFSIGFFLSFPIQMLVYRIIIINSFVLINEILLNWFFIFSTFLLLPLLLSLLNFGYLTMYLKTPPLEISNPQQTKQRGRVLIKGKSVKNWKIRKPFELALIVPSTKRTKIVIAALSLCFVAFCFEINTKQFMTSLTDQWTPIYQNIDSSFNLDYKFDWKKIDNKKLTFDKSTEYNIKFDYYENPNFIEQQIDLNTEAEIENYLKSAVSDPNQIIKILLTKISGKTFRLSSLKNLMFKIVRDFKTSAVDFPIPEDVIKSLEDNWISQFNNLDKKIINQNIPITFNNIFIKKGVDFPIYKIELNNSSYGYPNADEWKLILLNDYSSNAFKWEGIEESIFSELQIADEDCFPVVVTEHFARLNNLKVGDFFEADLAKNHEDSSLKMKIKGINKKDIYTNNIYGYDKLFINSFTELNNKNLNLINDILTKNQTLIFSKDLSDFKINNNYFSFFVPGNNDDLTFIKFLTDPEKNYDFITWNSFGNEKYENYTLQKQISRDKTQNFNDLMDIIGLATFLILGILYLVLILVAFLEERDYLAALKAMGLNNWFLNLNLNLRILLGIVLACTVGIVANYFIWNIVINILSNKAKILSYSPFNWSVVLMGITIIFTIFSLGTATMQVLLTKMKIAYKK